ncbi:ferrochelatase [Tenacibaculum skagerrakense]|uniref:Ferrochelatase n=1 Tax=Tenacibaculum skagerrakense TaxID=186571 RepID=A0A4R2NSS0_9FLAO|nr:ferrochelatase [Tenacibaculum skagerrakense]TCP24611.1 ferrochelatase [Tenacibaculum skagerrakense]
MKGVLLVNLGSPNSTDPKDVKKYLDEFLMDQRVIDVPFWLRSFIVRGIILNTRPKKSAAAYKKIWWDEGSPLIVLSERLQAKVQDKTDIPVGLAMRYGNPSIKSGLQELYDKGVRDLLLVPLYPQFAMATTETIVVLAEELRNEFFSDMKITDVPAFYNKPEYIKALSNSIKDYLSDKEYDHIMFSYHGVPERHIRKSDVTKSHCKIDGSCCNTPSKAHEFCYRHQCFQTTKNVMNELGLEEDKVTTTFQSRLGVDPWLQPYTDRTLVNKAEKDGVKKLAIVTPAFVSDCLETLEEIAMEGKEEFLEAGGEEFHTVPCINDNDEWVAVLAKWINEFKES